MAVPPDVTNRSNQSVDPQERPDKTVMMDQCLLPLRSVADVLRGMEQISSVAEAADTLTFGAVSDEISSQPASPPSDRGGREQVGDCDPTVEQYVAGLIARSNGSATQVLASTSANPTPAPPASPSPTSGTRDPMQLQPKPTQGPVTRHEPEGRDVITNLRDLANMNARSVLDIHSGHCLIVQMHSKLAVAMVSIVVSFALVNMVRTSHSLVFSAAVCALIASFVWSSQYLKLARRLQKACRQTEQLDCTPE